jgi:hypothetical protein
VMFKILGKADTAAPAPTTNPNTPQQA